MATTRSQTVAHGPDTAAARPEPSSAPRRDPQTRERKRDEPPAGRPDQVDPPATRRPGEPAVPGDPETDPPDPDDPMRSGT